MAINFPDSPSLNETFTDAGRTWKWDGTSWRLEGNTNNYILPIASSTVLGGIKIGTNLTIDASTGVLSATLGSQANSDWNATSGVEEILNKPTIPAAQIRSDWTQTDTTSLDYILNKPTINDFILTVQDEGGNLTTGATSLNFTGAGVVASGSGAIKTITIPGASGTTNVATDDTPPSSPIDGDMWWNSEEGQLKVWYEDVDTSQWVDAAGGGQPAVPDLQEVTDVGYTTTNAIAADGGFSLGTNQYASFTRSSGANVLNSNASTLQVIADIHQHYVGSTNILTIASTGVTSSGLVNDAGGNVRSLPVNTQAAAYQLVSSDVGKMIKASGDITIAGSNIFQEGDCVTIYNSSAGDINITRSSTNLYLVGDSTDQDRVLAQKGIATVVCVGSNEYVLMGGGIT